MKTLEPIIAAHEFFAGMDPSGIRELVGCASNLRVEAGAYLYREGEEAQRLYLIRQGRVALEIFAPQHPPTVVSTFEAGEAVGWSWLQPPFRWHTDARAVTAVRAIALDAPCLRAKCDRDPALGYALWQRFSSEIEERLHATRLQLLDVYAPRT